LLSAVLSEHALQPGKLARVVATGYARQAVIEAQATVTEITCHARGVTYLLPGTSTIIEIGGQDSKVIFLEADGSVRDFAMNERCAAGSGRFLEVLAPRLGVGLHALGALAAESNEPAAVNSTCVVFAENEITGLLATGAAAADVAAGTLASLASRVAAMVGVRVRSPVVMTGGVALVPGMAAALEAAVGLPVETSPDAQFTGALGAALLAGAQVCQVRGTFEQY
jgi:predicted CoA-substrate-specific enzyme activase